MDQFPEQSSTEMILASFIYTVGAVAVVLVVAGLVLIDMGMVRRRNVLDTVVQKFGAAMIAGLGTLLIGYPIWQWQFNQAFGVPSPLWQAVKDWWLGGFATNTPARYLDPAVFPEADVLQIFLVFFVTFSMAGTALLHTAVVERIKPLPLYVIAFVFGAIVSPLVGYFCWGSLSPLTVRGTHDFDGVFPLYICAGTVALVLSWRIGPRLGALTAHVSGLKPAAGNAAFVALGVLLIVFALPFVCIGSGFILFDDGFYGISFTVSGIGIMVSNLFASILGGAAVGMVIAYRRREVSWALFGPIAGVVMAGTLLDIGEVWESLIVGGCGPVVVLLTAALVRRLGIDDPKVVPLALGPGIVGAIVTGFLKWGTATGGYPGLEGKWALGAGSINPGWQLLGVVTTMVISGGITLVLCLIFERFGGLRVTEDAELKGLDEHHWETSNFADDLNAA